MATTPSFASTPKTGSASLSVANVNRDGTGTVVSLFTPGTSGSRATSLTIKATVTTTAQLVKLFRSTDAGTTWRLWREIPVSAVTAATGTSTAEVTYSLIDAAGAALSLSTTDRLGAAAETANTMNVVTEYQDL